MEGTLHALGLLAVILATTLVVWRYGQRPHDHAFLIYGTTFGILAFLLGCLFTQALTYNGQPVMQLAIPSLCIAITYATIPHDRVMLCTTLPLFVAMLALGIHFNILCATPRYTGDPPTVNHDSRREAENNVRHLTDAILLTLQDDPTYAERAAPAGGLERSKVLDGLPLEEISEMKYTLHVRHYVTFTLWHTWFTGLYGKHANPQTLSLWYPGGKLKDAVKHIAYRHE